MGINLTEPTIVSDIFVSGIIPEDLGDGTMRFTCYVKQRSFDFDGDEYVVVNRIIRPVPSIITGLHATMKALGIACCGGERLRLVH